MNLCAQEANTKTTIRYPSPGSSFERHHVYPLALLKLAFEKAACNAEFLPSDVFMPQARAIRQVENGDSIDVIWTMTSAEREAKIHPVRIPLYKGLIGWRVLLANKEHVQKATSGLSLEELKSRLLIQGHGWPDAKVLKSNGFNVTTAPGFEGLFKQVVLGRAEYFPRSIIEVWGELENWRERGLALEPYMLIRYPTASYFFTSKENTALGNVIQEGLERALEDGSYDALFYAHFGTQIAQANISQRTIFSINNPLLSPDTPLDRSELWFQPGEASAAKATTAKE